MRLLRRPPGRTLATDSGVSSAFPGSQASSRPTWRVHGRTFYKGTRLQRERLWATREALVRLYASRTHLRASGPEGHPLAGLTGPWSPLPGPPLLLSLGVWPAEQMPLASLSGAPEQGSALGEGGAGLGVGRRVGGRQGARYRCQPRSGLRSDVKVWCHRRLHGRDRPGPLPWPLPGHCPGHHPGPRPSPCHGPSHRPGPCHGPGPRPGHCPGHLPGPSPRPSPLPAPASSRPRPHPGHRPTTAGCPWV